MTQCSKSRCLCPRTDLMDVLASKYTMQVVCIVDAHGTIRFSELEEHLPEASTSTLSTRLEELAAEGFVRREQYDEIPPRVEYELTERGEELGERLQPLLEWARDDQVRH